MNYLKNIVSILALSVGLSFASSCKPAGEEGNGNGSGYDGGLPPPEEQCLTPAEFAETTIYSSTTVCPGTYRGVSLRISTDDVTLQGAEVTLDGLLAGGTAIYAEGISRLAVKRFTLKDYGKGIHLKDVKDSSIEDTNYSAVGNGVAIVSEQGLAIRITGGKLMGDVQIDGSSYEILNATIGAVTETPYRGGQSFDGLQVVGNRIEKGISLHSGTGQGYIIRENEVKSISLQHPSNATIEDNILLGGGITGWDVTMSTIRRNTINCERVTEAEGAASGINLYARSSDDTIESNIITNCSSGISVGIDLPGGHDINILNNTVQLNWRGATLDVYNSRVEGNIISNNQEKGLVIKSCGNVVTNNDLRNNGEGNDLYECDNTYENNLE